MAAFYNFYIVLRFSGLLLVEFELIEYQMSRFNCNEGDNFFLKLTNFSNSFPINFSLKITNFIGSQLTHCKKRWFN